MAPKRHLIFGALDSPKRAKRTFNVVHDLYERAGYAPGHPHVA